MLVTILCCRHHDGDCFKMLVAKFLFGDFWLVFRFILRISNIRQHSKQYQKSVTNIDVTMEPYPKGKRRLHQYWLRMLETKCVGAKFEMLMTDLIHWENHQHNEKKSPT